MEQFEIASEAAVNWNNYARDIMCEWLKTTDDLLLGGANKIVEIDESLFGRQFKYNRGSKKGKQIWIFGMVDRSDGRVMVWPVEDRTKETLLPIIQKHIRAGTDIYSDGWAAYQCLEENGYQHWTVNHKDLFQTTITRNGETKVVHTNRIEGFWGNAKAKFKHMRGTSPALFFSHLAEVVWRTHHQEAIVEDFFDQLTNVYTLDSQPKKSENRLFNLNFELLDEI